MINSDNILSTLLSKEFMWRKVNEQPCIHTFYNKHYINLCLWHFNDLPVISIDVDKLFDVDGQDIVDLDIQEGDPNFDKLLSVYQFGMKNGVNIAA